MFGNPDDHTGRFLITWESTFDGETLIFARILDDAGDLTPGIDEVPISLTSDLFDLNDWFDAHKK